MIEGIIKQMYCNIQFSILWTDAKGNRIFKIVTYSQKLSNNKQQILCGINYGNVNLAYLWAVLHNVNIKYNSDGFECKST